MRSSWQRAVNLRRDDVGAKKRNVRGISMMYVDLNEITFYLNSCILVGKKISTYISPSKSNHGDDAVRN